MIDFRELKTGDTVTAWCCDHCIGNRGLRMKRPADSGKDQIWCDLCGHLGIGSKRDCVVGDWNTLRPVAHL